MLTRRGFLARLAAAPIVALALLKAPVVEAEVPWYDLGSVAYDPSSGIAIRFISQYDIEADRHPTRLDCFAYQLFEPVGTLDYDITVPTY